MRLLSHQEALLVAGGLVEALPLTVFGEGGGTGGTGKNNNGYGNGAESGLPPGQSGAHNPQLLGWNLGPRGVR